MSVVAIVGGGPKEDIPDLSQYVSSNVTWIGADRGNLTLLEAGITPMIAVGDFDSLTTQELETVKSRVKNICTYPIEKDATDLELAIEQALSLYPTKIYIFGVTGGRKDHELISYQLLYRLEKRSISSAIINKQNWIELKLPKSHTIEYDPMYKYISFIPQSHSVKNVTLEGFYYPLQNKTIEIGSSISVSNHLIGKKGTFSFTEGILLLVKSHDGRQ
ncbi:thiamine diphosphokinase [Salirhabdus sp. Marseille-P4669]|uniref:thiamine diphosphokinase n=1 Tax=Salirhabdus sp. Marseille-P4669 TaxID=2042310 RepID=UPI000C7C9455|nr:thiamine diphosphokinase [Salirhabdus sp. Marseille-P4669]